MLVDSILTLCLHFNTISLLLLILLNRSVCSAVFRKALLNVPLLHHRCFYLVSLFDVKRTISEDCEFALVYLRSLCLDKCF